MRNCLLGRGQGQELWPGPSTLSVGLLAGPGVGSTPRCAWRQCWWQTRVAAPRLALGALPAHRALAPGASPALAAELLWTMEGMGFEGRVALTRAADEELLKILHFSRRQPPQTSA